MELGPIAEPPGLSGASVNEATSALTHHPPHTHTHREDSLGSSCSWPLQTDPRRVQAVQDPQREPGSKAGPAADTVHIGQARLHALPPFPKGKVVWREIQNNTLTQPQLPTLKKSSLIYSCERSLLVESPDTGNWQKYSEFSIYRRLGRSKGENILLEICLLSFFFFFPLTALEIEVLMKFLKPHL